MGDLALTVIIGHEKERDDSSFQGSMKQINSVDGDDFDQWYQAVHYDETGQYQKRDQTLWDTMEFKNTTQPGDAEADREGNSLQDFRLSLMGYRFARYVWKNPSLPPPYGGYWLRIHLSADRQWMSPFGP